MAYADLLDENDPYRNSLPETNPYNSAPPGGSAAPNWSGIDDGWARTRFQLYGNTLGRPVDYTGAVNQFNQYKAAGRGSPDEWINWTISNLGWDTPAARNQRGGVEAGKFAASAPNTP